MKTQGIQKISYSYFGNKFVIRRHLGVSFYELIIVMAIIGIIAVITIPMIKNFSPSLKLTSSAKAISSKLRQAQEEAVTTQIRHGIKFNPIDSPPNSIAFIKVETGGDTTLETLTLPAGITLATDGTIGNIVNNNKIVFSADGGPSCAGTITVTYDTFAKNVTVSPSGLIKQLQ